jgi:hypothetical protein
MNARTREEKRALLARFKKPVDLELKVSGIIAEVVPPPVAAWVVAGEVPESLFGAAMSAVQSGPSAVAEALNLPEMFKLALRMVRASFIWPKTTLDYSDRVDVTVDEDGPPRHTTVRIRPQIEDDEDTLNPETLPMEDLSTVLAWGLSGAKGAVVQTDSGEVTSEALGTFRQNGGVPSHSENVGQVQAESGA